jgi:hypothetical protein
MDLSSASQRVVVAAISAAFLGGCDFVLGLRHFSPPPDAPVPPDAPPCVTPAVHDTFDTDPPCSQWGHTDEAPVGTTVTVANGQLVFMLAPNIDQTRGACEANQVSPFTPDSGVFVQTGTATSGPEFKVLMALWGTNVSVISWSLTSIDFGRGADVNHLTSYGTHAFDPVLTAWVRMRPLPDMSAIVAEYGSDGLHWNLLGTDPITPPTDIAITLIGGTFAATPSPAPITFDGLDTCPL